MSIKPFYILAAAALMSCSTASITPGVHRDFNLITEDEISATLGTNAYDVVSKLRPNFLKTRGRTTISAPQANEYAVVFIEGQFYGNLNSLQSISTSQVHEIRYLSGTEAVNRYGMQYGSGVIDIRMK